MRAVRACPASARQQRSQWFAGWSGRGFGSVPSPAWPSSRHVRHLPSATVVASPGNSIACVVTGAKEGASVPNPSGSTGAGGRALHQPRSTEGNEPGVGRRLGRPWESTGDSCGDWSRIALLNNMDHAVRQTYRVRDLRRRIHRETTKVAPKPMADGMAARAMAFCKFSPTPTITPRPNARGYEISRPTSSAGQPMALPVMPATAPITNAPIDSHSLESRSAAMASHPTVPTEVDAIAASVSPRRILDARLPRSDSEVGRFR